MAEDKIRVAICGSANCALVLTTLFHLSSQEDLVVDCVMTEGCEGTSFDGYPLVDERPWAIAIAQGILLLQSVLRKMPD